MTHPEPSTLTVAPPLHPVEIAHRAYVALHHQPKHHDAGFTCDCGARLPCAVATALLADIAADWARIQGHPIDADTTTPWRKS